MNTFASTFIAGFGPVVEEQMKKLFPNVEITKIFDGLVVYKTNVPIENIKSVAFFSNTFLVFTESSEINESAVDISPENLNAIRKLGKTFRIVFSRENQMHAVDSKVLAGLERTISAVTGFTVSRNKPQLEFWFALRSEGYGFFGLRLTKHPDYKKVLPAGELRPDLAALLCLISQPNSKDVFLDPFAGFGAIPFQRAVGWPYKEIIANDIEPTKTAFLKNKLQGLRNWWFTQEDALNLRSIKPASIDKIVTDPPWGYFEHQDTNFNNFFAALLVEFARILRPNGIAVILTAKKEEFLTGLNNNGNFSLLAKHDVLVSGKKASVFSVKKN